MNRKLTNCEKVLLLAYLLESGLPPKFSFVRALASLTGMSSLEAAMALEEALEKGLFTEVV